MDLNLKGRVALITGSTRGLGKAIAESLAAEGADIIVNGRWSKTVGNTAYEIEHKFHHNINAHQFTCDVTNSKGIKEFFQKKMPQLGRLDILINNVGNIEKFGSFIELEDEDWLRCYDLTFMSAVRLIREALPFLTASGNGRIINISSLIAHQPGKNFPHYAPAKAALNNLTKYLAGTLGNSNITVNAICPSNIDRITNVKDRAKRDGISIEDAERKIHEEENKSPLGRVGSLEDVANLVAYLASDKAVFMTGHIYNVDGGITKGI